MNNVMDLLKDEHMESVSKITRHPELQKLAKEMLRDSIVALTTDGKKPTGDTVLAAALLALASLPEVLLVLTQLTFETKCPEVGPLHCMYTIPHAIGLYINVELGEPLHVARNYQWAHDYYIECWLDTGDVITAIEKEIRQAAKE